MVLAGGRVMGLVMVSGLRRALRWRTLARPAMSPALVSLPGL